MKTCWWRPRNAASTSAATAASADPQEVTIACPVLGESGSACSVWNIYRKKKTNKLVEKSNKLPGALQGWNVKQEEATRPCSLSHLLFSRSSVFSVRSTQSMKSTHRTWSPYTGAAPGTRRPEASALQGGQGESRVDQQSRIFSKCFLINHRWDDSTCTFRLLTYSLRENRMGELEGIPEDKTSAP